MSGPHHAESARESNNAQIMTRGGCAIAPEVAKRLTDHWLDSEFEAGRPVLTVAKPSAVDTRHRGVGQPARSPGS